MTALLRASLPIVAIVAFAIATSAIVRSAGTTLGYDYEAYVAAARRAVDGIPLYDTTVDVAGGFAIFLYPPPFAFALIPFALAPEEIGLWAWELLVIGSFLVGVAVLPTRSSVRWAILLLGALDWPLLYSFKLGQVGPILFMLFAIGWRWRERTWPLGISMATGILIKVQPAILLVWAVMTGRWRASAVAIGILSAASVVTAAAVGTGTWIDYAALLGRVSAPVTTPHNFTLGAILYQAGAAEQTAGFVQVAMSIAVIALVLVTIRTASAEVSYLTTAVASQVLSPLLWDHYAVVLLLPTAWLLERRHWWAIGIPLLTALPLVGIVPAAIYPVVFGVGLVGPAAVEILRRRGHGDVGRVPRSTGTA